MSICAALIPRSRCKVPEVGMLAPRATLGAACLYAESAVPLVANNRAILLGWAFRRADFRPYEALSTSDVGFLVASQGSWAIEHLWGNYLLFWLGDDQIIRLLRAPVTGPAIYIHYGANNPDDRPAVCAFTDLRLVRRLGLSIDALDPAAIDAELRYPLLRGPATGLARVHEVMPGEIVRLDGRTGQGAGWLPWQHIAERPVEPDPVELRNIVCNVVGAWATRFNALQLELSGGLDSSIVAAALTMQSTRWRAVSFATIDKDGDERPYARAMAARANVELAELLVDNQDADPLAAMPLLRARPGGFGLLADLDAKLLAAARNFGAEAIMTGAGGDNIFGYLTSTAPVADAFRFAGPRAALAAARDLAEMMNDTLWRAIWLTAARSFRPAKLWACDNSLLSTRYAERAPDHPWFAAAAHAPAGQRAYALKLLPIMPYLDGYDRALAMPMIAPLLSQPIAEFGLSVASWRWNAGGQDRAFARQAFRALLPERIVSRRSKGRIESLIYPVYLRHRERLCGFLLDGWLAGEAIIDCDAVAQLLAGDARTDSASVMRLLHLVDVERWARSIIASRSGA